MHSIVVERRLTLGNIIEVSVIIVAVIVGYARLQFHDELFQSSILRLQATVDSIKTEYVQQPVYQVQIQDIKSSLEEIKAELKEIKTELRK